MGYSPMHNMGPIGLLLMLAFIVFLPLCFWKIYTKAGFAGFWGLFAIIPLGAFVLIGVLAFAKWPANQEVSE